MNRGKRNRLDSTLLKKVVDLCAAHRTYTQTDLEYKWFDNAMEKERVKSE